MDLIAGKLSKPAFNLFQPASRCWRDMHQSVPTARQICLDPRCLVVVIVKHDDMLLRPRGQPPAEFLDEVEEPHCAVVFGVPPELRSGGNAWGAQ